MILVEIIVVGLVAYRLWHLLARDSITIPIQRRVERQAHPLVWEWWSCGWCSGTWYAVGVTLSAYFAGLITGSPWLVAPAAAFVVGWLGERV